MAEEVIRLALYESRTIVPLATRAPGPAFTQKMAIEANSLLSTVFVESADVGASLVVEYHDAGAGEDAGEDILVGAHPPLTTTGSNRRVIAPFHNKPRLVFTVTGGSVRFGVYVTVVQQIAVDLINALHLDAAAANLASDEGIGVSIYDPVQGKFFLWRGSNGVPEFALTDRPGSVLEGTASVTPGPEAALLSATVPGGQTWQLRYGEVCCQGYGRWRLVVDGTRIAGGATGPAREHDRSSLPGFVEAVAGQIVELLFTYYEGPADMTVDSFVGYVVA